MGRKKKDIPAPTNRGRIPDKILNGIIEDLKSGMTESEVSEKHGRPLDQIMRLYEIHMKPFLANPNDKTNIQRIQNFKARPEWNTFNQEFSKDEMEMFLYEYCKLMTDFDEDEIKAAEENQLFMSIRYWILMHRNMMERKKTTVDIENLEKQLLDTVKKGKDHKDFGGDGVLFNQMIMLLEQKVQVLQSANNAKTTEHKTLTEKHQKFMEDLKVTRNQRIERFNQNKNKINFLEVIRDLEDEENRKNTGIEIELAKMSMNKQEKEWGKFHTFADNERDRLILDSDTLKEDENEED